MIDTLMAIWNRGYGGRGILVSLAFLLICISISLLLVTVGNFWTALWPHHGPPAHSSNTLSASLTATAQPPWKVATPGGTPLVYAPTITPTTNPCLLSPTTGKVVHAPFSPTPRHAPVSPTATPHPRPTVTTTPHPRPTNTPTATATPTVIATATSTPIPSPTATATATSTPTPTATPTSTPTATPTPLPSPTATATSTPTPVPTTAPTVTPTVGTTPTVGVTPTVPSRRRGKIPVPVPSATTTQGQNKTVGSTNCAKMYSGNGDSVGLTFNGSPGALLRRNLWIILGGSTVGTLLFYVIIYLLNRKRNLQQETSQILNEHKRQSDR